MTKTQRKIIIGTILGDGWIDGKSLRIKQSNRYKEYVFWLYSNFKEFSNQQPKQRKDNKQWYFQTRFLPEIQEYKVRFYKDGRKIIPDDIIKLLISPLSLAVWYMDDGSLDYRPKDHYNFSLVTNAFTLEENRLLIKALKNNFGIEASIQNPLCRGKKYPEIYIGAKGRDRFVMLIKPYILKCFSKKLPPQFSYLDPSETDSLTRKR